MFFRLVVFYVMGVLAVNAMNIRIHPVVAGLLGGVAIFVAVVLIRSRVKPARTTKRKRRKGVKK